MKINFRHENGDYGGDGGRCLDLGHREHHGVGHIDGQVQCRDHEDAGQYCEAHGPVIRIESINFGRGGHID